MQSNLYVDNVISGSNSEEVVSYYKKSRALISQANFNLRSWASNNIQLQNLAKQDGTAETSNIVKVLGLQWNTSSDQLSLTPRDITPTTPLITKRDVLRDSSSILGLITPVTIQAKIFLQELWGKNLQWDQPLNDELKKKWNISSRTFKMLLPVLQCLDDIHNVQHPLQLPCIFLLMLALRHTVRSLT